MAPGIGGLVKRTEIDALVRVHRGRSRPVAFLHVLRQSKLEEDDHVFLREHAADLAVPDLLAWRSRCAPGFTGAVLRAIARIALEDPVVFEHEVLAAPRFDLDDEEWIELADLTRGKVPARIFDRIVLHEKREVSGVVNAPAAPVGDADLAGFLDAALAEFDPLEGHASLAIDASLSPEVVLERARNAFSAEERAMLLEWSAAHGIPRKPLVDVAVPAIRAGENDPRLRSFLASQLGARAAWEAHGLDVFLAFLDRGAFAGLSELCTVVWSSARARADSNGEAPRGLLHAMSASFAGALVHVARESLAASLPARAMAALSALACLDPPSRLSRAIHDLLRAPGVEGEVRVLVELNVRLVKHGTGRDASFESLVAAIHCLADVGPEA
jgi:hypothetical protein